MKESERVALEATRRLHELGFVVRSPSLELAAKEESGFYERGGNRAMRRARKRGKR